MNAYNISTSFNIFTVTFALQQRFYDFIAQSHVGQGQNTVQGTPYHKYTLPDFFYAAVLAFQYLHISLGSGKDVLAGTANQRNLTALHIFQTVKLVRYLYFK